MNPLRIFLMAALILVVFGSTEADAEEMPPMWISGNIGEVSQVAISADGEYIVASTNLGQYSDGSIYLFNKNSSPLWSYSNDYSVTSVAISEDGEYIVASFNDNNVYLFDKDNSTPLWNYTAVRESNNCDCERSVYSVSISADGNYIAIGGDHYSVDLFHKDSSEPLWRYSVGVGVYSVAISADGEYIAAGSADSKVYLFDKDSSTPLWNYTTGASGGGVNQVGISADGEVIIARTTSLYLFDKDSSTPLWNYTTGDSVDSLAISADGEYIVASTGNKVCLFNEDSSTPLWCYTANNGQEYRDRALGISAHGEYITVVSHPNSVYLFDKDSTLLWNYTVPLTGLLADSLRSVAISADGKYVIVGEYPSRNNPGHIHFISNNFLPIATIDSIFPSPATFGDEITFGGSGSDRDGTVIAYEWNSSIDGFLSDKQDFSTDISVGNHTIYFRVQDNEEEWSEVNITELIILPNTPPIGRIDSIRPSPAEKGANVLFNGIGSDIDGTVVNYQWMSSLDGVLSTKANFSSSNLSLGHHAITFRVQDNDGEWSNETSELYIGTPPIASASHWNDGSNDIRPGQNVQFNGEGSDEDGTIVLYEWDFNGDGEFDWSGGSNGKTSYTYMNLGTYYAVLRVTDNDGFTATDSRVITVSEDGDGGGSIPSVSLIPALISIGLIAIFRRK